MDDTIPNDPPMIKHRLEIISASGVNLYRNNWHVPIINDDIPDSIIFLSRTN